MHMEKYLFEYLLAQVFISVFDWGELHLLTILFLKYLHHNDKMCETCGQAHTRPNNGICLWISDGM